MENYDQGYEDGYHGRDERFMGGAYSLGYDAGLDSRAHDGYVEAQGIVTRVNGKVVK